MPGQPHVAYRDGELFVDDARLGQLVKEHGTPLFVYSKAAMLAALAAYQRGFTGRKVQICYAMKANSSLGVLQVFARAGCGFDIVSGGELERVLAAGAVPAKSSSPAWAKRVQKCAARWKPGLVASMWKASPNWKCSMKWLGPWANAHPSAYASTRMWTPKPIPIFQQALKGSKFGIAHERTLGTYQRASALAGLQVVGIDCHIGSQITQEAPYLDAVDRMLDLVEVIEGAGIPIHHIDFGGGLGINYNGDQPPQADQLWTRLLTKLDARGFGQRQLMIEPGRSLVGNAGVCLTEVLYLKPGEQKNFCIVDAAMNDLPRPAMYQAYHQIVPVTPRSDTPTTWEVVGPVCESGDWIGHDRELGVQPGDVLAVLSAGSLLHEHGQQLQLPRSRG